jgi:hypothetical protein
MRPLQLFALAALASFPIAFAPACASSGSTVASPDSGPPPEGPGADATVQGFEARRFSFTGSENLRTGDVEVTFPAEGTYARITLTLTLACPDGKCDPWDRAGTVGVVTDAGDAGTEDDAVVEIARIMTPYGVGGTWTYDLTPLRPLLRGTKTLRGFIDTWVGPGSRYGNGWSLTTTFAFEGGTPEREPIAVIPIWQHGSDASVVVGDPEKPVGSALPDRQVTLPRPASAVAMRTIVTGHGQGNSGNCAEFCKLAHRTSVGGEAHEWTPWRADCRQTAVPGQQGTWTLPRAGWCPGADVKPWDYDVTGLSAEALAGRAPIAISHAIAPYENVCRPPATDSGTCDTTACVLGTGCAYDGGNHTEPFLRMSTVLIAYR